ncbi:hypothetical protein Ancab_000680 [Ancistrocladus abbreviatus]
MNSLAAKLLKHFTTSTRQNCSFVGVQRSSKLWQSTASFDGDDNDDKNNGASEDFNDDFVLKKRESVPQTVDPRRGWNFRGVHKAIICGRVGQNPVQKLLRNGKTLTIFNVGTGGMLDHRITGEKDSPKPAQWHRIVVHNEILGAYAVQQLVKSSQVYVEGDIEIRVFNKSITGEIVKLPEICVRHDGKIRLIKTGETIPNISFEELRAGLV